MSLVFSCRMLALVTLGVLAADPPSFDLEAAHQALRGSKVSRAFARSATAAWVTVLTEAPATKGLFEMTRVVGELRAKASLTADATRARDRGQKHYNARNFGLACKAFDAALELDPTNAERWADVGLCAFKLGNVERGIASSRAAIALGDPAVRKNAAYNLRKFAPDHGGDAPGCDERFVERQISWSRTGCDAHYCYDGSITWAFFGRAADTVEACAETLTSQLQKEDDAHVTSARAIGSTVALPECASFDVVNTVRTTGGYPEDNVGVDATSGRRCQTVYSDACRGLVVIACDDGHVAERTP
jgi:tetratricopeptide (TPR) repeat protein